MLAQVIETAFQEKPKTFLKRILWIFKHLEKHPNIVLKFSVLDEQSLELQVYSDAFFETNHNETSHLEYIIYLLDKYQLRQPLQWNSYRSKRSTRSVLGSKIMAFYDAFHIGFSLTHDLGKILGSKFLSV